MTLIRSLVLVSLLAAVGSAQGFGNAYLISSGNVALLVNRTTGQASTLATTRTGAFDWVDMGVGNRYALGLVNSGSTAYLVRIPPSGALLTVTTIPTPQRANGLTLDQDGRAIITTADGVVRSAFLASVRTIASAPVLAPSGVCMDDDTGDYVVSNYRNSSNGWLVRIDRKTKAMTTIASGLPGLTACDHDQATGRFFVTTRIAPQLRVLNRSGVTVASKSFSGDLDGVRVDDTTGDVHVINGGQIHRLDSNLNVQRTYGSFGFIGGIDLWGVRRLTGNHTGVRGSRAFVDGNFPNYPNSYYVAAIGFSGLRPGLVTASGHRINVAFDGLVFATLAGKLPLFTQRFQGNTDSSGIFSAEFTLPNLVVGYTITFSASVLSAAAPGGIAVAPSATFTVR